MNIAFDAKRLFQNFTGLGNYSRTIVKNLELFFPDHQYHLLTPKVISNATTKFFINNPSFHVHQPNHSFGSIWRTIGQNSILESQKIDVFHGLSHEIPLNIKKTGIPTVVTIHDLIFRIYPNYYPYFQREIYDWKFKFACNNADVIIAISEQTKKDIIDFYGIDESKIKVVYQTCDDRFQSLIDDEKVKSVKQKYNLPQNYMLYVGSIIERKNLLRIVQAMHILQPNFDIPLVVIGEGKSYKNQVLEFVRTHNLENRVIFIDKIIYTQLPEIYAGAELFLYPSEYEGFGIPVIESLYMKTPVITSNCSCLPEAAGPHSLLVNPKNVVEIANAIEKILSDTSFSHDISEKGHQYVSEKFSPYKVTRDVMQVYNSIL